MMAEHREATDMSANVDDSANVMLSKFMDLIFILEDCVGELHAGRFDEEVAAVNLVASGEVAQASTSESTGVNSIGILSCSSQAPRQMPSVDLRR